MNGFDDFDTQVHSDEMYSDSIESWESEDTTEEYPHAGLYPHDLDGFEYPEFDN